MVKCKSKDGKEWELTYIMNFKQVLCEWSLVAGTLFNEAYQENGPGHAAIEEFETDIEYQICVVKMIIDAWTSWLKWNKIEAEQFHDLTGYQQELVVKAALDNDIAAYGCYRGNLPNSDTIRETLNKI
jgi:hypothetical protein